MSVWRCEALVPLSETVLVTVGEGQVVPVNGAPGHSRLVMLAMPGNRRVRIKTKIETPNDGGWRVDGVGQKVCDLLACGNAETAEGIVQPELSGHGDGQNIDVRGGERDGAADGRRTENEIEIVEREQADRAASGSEPFIDGERGRRTGCCEDRSAPEQR